MSVIAEREGILLTGVDLLLQIKTRRPLLLNHRSLDLLVYFPELGPEISLILKEVYGMNLLGKPPKWASPTGGISSIYDPYIKEIWEKRSFAGWKRIRQKFGVSDVIVYRNWNLKLPLIVSNENFILYHIPQNH